MNFDMQNYQNTIIIFFIVLFIRICKELKELK